MKRYRITYKTADGERQYIHLLAKDKADAEKQAERSQLAREQRFPLTFARLEEAASTGDAGMLAIDPKFAGKALTEAWVKAETEKRKRDHGRYVDDAWSIESVEEATH